MRREIEDVKVQKFSQSPQMRQKNSDSNEEKLNQLLAQLQMVPEEISDIDKAHHQMQESIKQMNLYGGGPYNQDFNGQNSLYELAQRVGHSSNFASMSGLENTGNEGDFFKGEGSLASANTGAPAKYTNHAID